MEEKYMKMAIELAKEGVYPYGAVIVKDGKVIGEASSGEINFDPTARAEVTAIRRACEALKTNDLSGATIYCSAEPCLMCFGAIWWANIREIVYGASIKDSVAINNHEINVKVRDLNRLALNEFKITRNVLGKEARSVMQKWYAKTNDQGIEVNRYILVVGTAFIRKGKLLVSMSQRSAKKGKYTLVGGGVEPGETFKEAAIRECREEIGNKFNIKPEELKEILCFREPALSDPTINIEMHMMLALKDIDVELKANEEIREFKWFSLGEDETILSTAIKDHFIPWAKENKIMY